MTQVRETLESIQAERGAAVMGVINVTPDSFYDGGRYLDARAARERIDRCVAGGADIIDVGGESSRPGAAPVPAKEQLRRVQSAVEYAVSKKVLVSIDTTSPEVADVALSLGAHIVNDVSCLADTDLARVASRHRAAMIIMHSRGPMSEMKGFSQWPDDAYDDVVEDLLRDWSAARDRAMDTGMPADDVLLDPGLGFAKNARHSFEVLARLDELARPGAPVVVGPGRKSFLAAASPSAPEDRLGGTVAASVLAMQHGAAAVRVHDVGPVRQALDVAREARRHARGEPCSRL